MYLFSVLFTIFYFIFSLVLFYKSGEIEKVWEVYTGLMVLPCLNIVMAVSNFSCIVFVLL